MTEKILLVDDDALLLESLRRELGLQYSIDTADSGAQGLEKIAKSGPYAVVVSDFRMPKMDGVKFLTTVMENAPDTVRMILTGNGDLPTAIEAINRGQIFRFLAKPCTGTQLSQALDAGLRQHQLILAEKELLEKTLTGSTSLLVEILAIVNPKAYGRSLRIQQLISFIVKQLNIKDIWQYEMAAALSQLGWITFSAQMLDKLDKSQPFTATEAVIFSNHPFAASKLLSQIPRLEAVSRIISGQDRSIDDLCLDPAFPDAYAIDLGSHMLKDCIDYDGLMLEGHLHDQILDRLRARKGVYLPEVLDALGNLHSFKPTRNHGSEERIMFRELEIGMLLLDPIRDIRGNVLVKADTYITRSVLIHLMGIGANGGRIAEPIRIAEIW